MVAKRASIVVTAENSEDGATVDVDSHVVARSIQDGVFGTTKERINLNVIVGHRDFGLFDGRGNKGLFETFIGPYRVTQLMQLRHFHYTGGVSNSVNRIIGSRLKRSAVVGIITVATAVYIANSYGCVGNTINVKMIGVVSFHTYGDGRAVIALYCFSNVIAAIHGMDAIAVDDGHLSLAIHVTHTASTEDCTVNHQSGLLFGVEGINCRWVLVRGRTNGFHFIFIICIRV